jgi:hypothetical protein
VLALFVVALLVGGLIVAVVFGAFGRTDRERTRALTEVAASQGLRFTRRNDVPAYRFADRAHGRNVLEGVWGGHRITVFDSAWGDADSHSPFSVVALHTGRTFPEVRCEPVQWTSFMRPQLPRFRTGDADLDTRYRISTRSDEFAADVLTPAFLATAFGGDVTLLAFADDAVVVSTWGLYPPERLGDVVAGAERVLAAIPPTIWDRLPPVS